MDSIQWGCCKNGNVDDDEPFITCIRCNKAHHFICLDIPEYPADSDVYGKWKCPDCMNVFIKSTKKRDTPKSKPKRNPKRIAMDSPDNTGVTAEDVRAIVQEVVKEEFNIIIQELKSSITAIVKKELKPLESDINSLKSSLEFHTKQFEDFQKEHETLKISVKNTHEINLKVNSSVTDLTQRINYLEQQARSSNVELQCVPERKDENLIAVVKQLAVTVGCDVKENNILQCTRVAKKDPKNMRPKSVIVQLSTPRLRDQLLASVISYNKSNPAKKLNSSHIGISGNQTSIYVVEHLSPSNKALHAAARLKAREMGFKFVWVRGGKIFVRKTETADLILIKDEESLKKMV